MKKLSEYIFFWALGGCIYYFFEILFRGFSHWSMFVLGGICLLFFLYSGFPVALEGTTVEAGSAMHYLCNGDGIHNRNYCQ